MKYKHGTIVQKSGTVFDNGDVDPRFWHPTFIPITRDDISDEVYYLIITSEVKKYLLYKKEYFMIDKNMIEKVHLERPSMINLVEIHRDKNFGNIIGGFPPDVYKDVIKKFKDWQEKHPHKYYEEVKRLLK